MVLEKCILEQLFCIFPDKSKSNLTVNNISEQYILRYKGDPMEKYYIAKHKLIWEVLHDGLEQKEIQCFDIPALKCPHEIPQVIVENEA